jgi:hypothetical protein
MFCLSHTQIPIKLPTNILTVKLARINFGEEPQNTAGLQCETTRQVTISVSFISEIAGAYLAGAAAALVSNPILLQLGVITGKKRRRRDSDSDVTFAPDLRAQEAEAVQQKLNEIALLERFIAQVNMLKITYSVALVGKRTIPPLVGEVGANFCG